MAAQQKNTGTGSDNKADDKLKTEAPIAEKDEVKQAEERTRKAHEKANKGQGKDG